MQPLLLFCSLIVGTFAATNPNFTVNVGGSNPPILSPQVIAYDSLSGPYQHVVILSIDGFHSVDLATYVKMKPGSTFAQLLGNAVLYTNTSTSLPSDSQPGTTALYTGALTRTHGFWYDDRWNRAYFKYGSNCQGTPGFNVHTDETIDANSSALDGGGAFDITKLPWTKNAWGECVYLLPHNLIRVSTIFEVVRNNGGFSKLADKHPSYELYSGPSGTGIYEGYFPEINSIADSSGDDYTANSVLVESWDDLHWYALYNWTAGNFQNGTKDPAGIPQLYASNFQSVSVTQKLHGYLPGSTSASPIFGPNLTDAIDHTDKRLGQLVTSLKTAGIYESTLLIVSAKHGQSPIDPSLTKLIDPATLQNATKVKFAYVTADDGAYIWLADASDANVQQAKSDLLNYAPAGVARILAGYEVYQAGFGDPKLDPSVPDLIVVSKIGVIYASVTAKKNMEHGGINPDDLTVAMFAHNPKLAPKTIDTLVFTRQIAVTAIEALGGPVSELTGAQIDGTVGLPGIF